MAEHSAQGGVNPYPGSDASRLRDECAETRVDHAVLIWERCEGRRQLADFKVPRQVLIVETFPRSALEKINRALLRRRPVAD
jgi:hypothetical protein